MQPLSNLPRATLLLEYAYYEGRDHLRHLTRFLQRLGYVAVTRKAPIGREVTTDDTRRLLKAWLKEQPAYPLHRRPTSDDFTRLKIQIINQYDTEEMR